jgi:hypothetical protein
LEELSRQCSSELDRIALYGNPALNPNQPRGVKFTVGVWDVPIGTDAPWEYLIEAERLVEIQNVGIASFGYITSPSVKKVLRTDPRWPNADTTTWEALEDKFYSSNEVDADAGEIFFGLWPQLTIGIWGADLIINPFSRASTAMVELHASLYCSVGIRRPACFGVGVITIPPQPFGRKAGVTVKPGKLSAVPPPESPAQPSEPTLGTAQAEVANQVRSANAKREKGAFR